MTTLCRNCGNDIPGNMDVIPGDTSRCRICGHIEILTPATKTDWVNCPNCGGKGGDDLNTCPECMGVGTIPPEDEPEPDQPARAKPDRSCLLCLAERAPGKGGLCLACFDKEAKAEEEATMCALLAIADLGLRHEGVGGKIGYNGEGYPGTGLRAPGMPFYDTRWNRRLKMLRTLEGRGYLANVSGSNKTGFSFVITEAGKTCAAGMKAQGWGVFDLKIILNPYERYAINQRVVRQNPESSSASSFGTYPKCFFSLIGSKSAGVA